jgi:phosphoglucosamine mutase
MVGFSVRSTNSVTAPTSVEHHLWGTVQLPTSPLFGTDGIRGQAGQLLTAPWPCRWVIGLGKSSKHKGPL